jgi:SAM-dependent methyltransferase
MIFPPEIDLDYLRQKYADLATFSDAELLSHYETCGKREGRIASPGGTRSGFISLISGDIRLLEIGPFCSPVFKGDRVRYFDVLDRVGLIERAKEHGLDPSGCPDEISYVSPTGDLGIVDETFDIVFSSHCIEHQPDLIQHLVQVRRILESSGRYFLIIPDKRYCFDHYIEESTPVDIIGAFMEKRRVHTFKSVYNYVARSTHNDAVRHWAGQSDDPRLALRAERTAQTEGLYGSLNGGYFDCHAWYFTPDGFRICLTELIEKSYVAFQMERVYKTVRDSNEFFCILKAA